MTGDRCGRDPATPVMGIASWHRPLMCLAAIMAVWAIVSVVGLAADTRTLGGDPLWAKPLKFAISFGVYALTLAWMLSLLRRPRLRRFAWWAGTVASAATLLEAAAISVQVVRGTGSHFNVATPLDSSLYALMGGGVVLMYAATVVIGSGLAFFSTFRDRALSWGLRLGLLIGLAGLSVGFLMVSPRAQQLAESEPRVLGSHSVGGEALGGLPLVGWSTVQGDLRISHFIGMHALQALPLLAILLASLAHERLTEGTRLRITLLVAAEWASVTVLTLWQALRGQSVIHPDTPTRVAAGALVAAGVVAAIGIFRHHLRNVPSPATTDQRRRR